MMPDFLFQRTFRKQALAFFGLPTAFLLAGCQAPSATTGAPPPPQVSVGHPLSREITDFDEFTARLAAVESVDIRARVSGYLQKINFKDGMEVKKDDLLFVIDPRPYQAEFDKEQADLDQATTQVALAKNDFDRATDLFKTNAISAEELDTRHKRWTTAEGLVKSAQALLETAKLNLDYTQIKAPINGRLSRRLVTEGNLVAGDGKDATLLTTLVSVDPVYAYADVDEATVIKYQQLDRDGLRKNNKGFISAELALGNTTEFSHKGVIDFIDNQIQSGTGTLVVRAIFTNADRTLIPGEFGRLRVIGSGKYNGMLIPDYAIGSDQDKKVVFVVKADNTIESRQVVPGQLVDGLRVVRSGLSESDWVVLDRLMIIRPGSKVVPKETPIKPIAPPTAAATQPANP